MIERFAKYDPNDLDNYYYVNSGKKQLWDTSKTVCTQIIAELKRGFTVLKVTRNGADRNTSYTIEGVQ